MEQDQLGLPLEYQKMPEYFDAHNIGDDTEAKNAVLEKLLRQHKVNTVLDLTCGTGSQVFYLEKLGYKVTGSDFSPALLDMARDRAKKDNIDVKFIDGDMRTLEIGCFDAAITMFNAIGHVSKPDFEKTVRNIHSNLKSGGIYIFDIFNFQAITDEVIDKFNVDIENVVGNVKVYHKQHSEVDREKRLFTSHDYNTYTKNGKSPEICTNSFSLRIYTADELKGMLEQNGFETVAQYAMDGSEFIEDKSLNILTVAKKI